MSIKDNEPTSPDSFGGNDGDSHYMSTQQWLSDQSNPDPTPYERTMGRLLRYQVLPEETKRILEKLGIPDESFQELRASFRTRYPHLVKLLKETDGE